MYCFSVFDNSAIATASCALFFKDKLVSLDMLAIYSTPICQVSQLQFNALIGCYGSCFKLLTAEFGKVT